MNDRPQHSSGLAQELDGGSNAQKEHLRCSEMLISQLASSWPSELAHKPDGRFPSHQCSIHTHTSVCRQIGEIAACALVWPLFFTWSRVNARKVQQGCLETRICAWICAKAA